MSIMILHFFRGFELRFFIALPQNFNFFSLIVNLRARFFGYLNIMKQVLQLATLDRASPKIFGDLVHFTKRCVRFYIDLKVLD